MDRRSWIDLRVQAMGAAAALVVCGGAAYAMHGSFIHFGLSFLFACAGVALFAAVLAAAGWCLFSAGPGASRESRIALNISLAAFVLAAAVTVSCVPGVWINSALRSNAMKWAESVAPSIEAYRTAHGDFPDSLSVLAEYRDAPRFVRDGHMHFGHAGDSFYFDLWDDSLIYAVGDTWAPGSDEWTHYD